MSGSWHRLSKKFNGNISLAVLGHLNIDIIYRLRELPEKGRSVNADDVQEHFGGTAGNLGVHASKLGVKTAICCYVGEDFPHAFRRFLETARIQTYDILVLPGYRTPRCHIFNTADGEQTYIIEQGAMDASEELPLWEETLRSAEMVHVSTGDPVRYARAVEGRNYAFDPGQEINYRYDRNRFMRLIRGSEIFFANSIEMDMALRLAGLADERELLELCPLLIRTAGPSGAYVIEKDGITHVPPCRPRRFSDTVGAGDAFRAGFYAARNRKYGMVEAVEFGNAMASISIEGGGGAGSSASWKKLFSRWKEAYE